MDIFLDFVKAFFAGGTLCLLGQLLIDRTGATPARILVGYVVSGVALSAVGLYAPFAQWAGAGASVPLTGFGHTLAEGVRKGVDKDGFMGIFTGGITATAAGITAAVVFGYLFAVISRPKDRR